MPGTNTDLGYQYLYISSGLQNTNTVMQTVLPSTVKQQSFSHLCDRPEPEKETDHISMKPSSRKMHGHPMTGSISLKSCYTYLAMRLFECFAVSTTGIFNSGFRFCQGPKLIIHLCFQRCLQHPISILSFVTSLPAYNRIVINMVNWHPIFIYAVHTIKHLHLTFILSDMCVCRGYFALAVNIVYY